VKTIKEKTMTFNALVPELSVSNIQESKHFYLDILGFHLEYERIENKFAFLSLGGAQIMIEEINENWNTAALEYPLGRGINLQISVRDVEALCQRLKYNQVPLFKEIFVSCYKVNDGIVNEKEILVQDPDGYLLRFSELIVK
jgi:catechol 2,3-dioxygenase-like lactoylglutathione lyase family enzyme